MPGPARLAAAQESDEAAAEGRSRLQPRLPKPGSARRPLDVRGTSVEKMLTHGSFVYETQSRSLPLYVMSLEMGDGSAPGHGCHFDGFQGVPLCNVSSGYGQFRGWLWVIEGSISDHGVQGQDTAVGQGEND